MTYELFFISGAEIFIIILAVLLIFGADKVPEMARTIGKTVKSIREATDDIKYEITKESYKIDEANKDLKKGVEDEQKSLAQHAKSLKEDIEDTIGPIKRTFK
jgi:sec-independent protein translocase protein TatA